MSILPWDNLQTFVHDWMKGLQEIVDSIAPDPGADNSMLPLATLPYKFDSTGYFAFNVRDITSDYSTSQYGYGYQKFVYGARINLTNNHLRLMSMQYIGRNVDTSPGTWDKVESVLQQINSARETLITDGSVYINNTYEDTYETIVSANASKIYFYPLNHSDSDISIIYPNVNGNVTKAGFSMSLQSTPITENAQGLIEPSISRNVAQIDHFVGDKTIAVFDSDTKAQYLVNAASPYSTNNDVINYTKAGSEYKLYYGDNYLIYALNSNNVYNYTDLFTGTKQATDTINSWNPSATPIKTPTYTEVKYGDELDANHTKPMVIKKFVPDANGMVYYYELDKADVWKVRSGLNTINLDVTVLKDVTRNLISYKIFAFSPTALIKTKTPVIVHIGGREIKYNGDSIPANYVEELNTITLGSINISKTFGDYRDYAPYTKLELFVPFCGWTTLPSWCIDTTITGELFVDMWNGSCKAVIKASALDAPDGVVVCEMGGVCAYDVPFVADATGAKAASLLSKVATTAGAVATGNPLAIATSGISLATALNENYTRMMGVVGDGSNINGLDHMFVKLTRVSWTDAHKKARPDAYKHMHGIPCGKHLTLSEGDGFTQINDANITGAMTDREKQMIIDGFRHGLIL